jgi:hypothetical protein
VNDVPARPQADEDPPPRKGVRIEYRATVPRRRLGVAIAEAFDIIEQETEPDDDPPTLD